MSEHLFPIFEAGPHLGYVHFVAKQGGGVESVVGQIAADSFVVKRRHAVGVTQKVVGDEVFEGALRLPGITLPRQLAAFSPEGAIAAFRAHWRDHPQASHLPACPHVAGAPLSIGEAIAVLRVVGERNREVEGD